MKFWVREAQKINLELHDAVASIMAAFFFFSMGTAVTLDIEHGVQYEDSCGKKVLYFIWPIPTTTGSFVTIRSTVCMKNDRGEGKLIRNEQVE